MGKKAWSVGLPMRIARPAMRSGPELQQGYPASRCVTGGETSSLVDLGIESPGLGRVFEDGTAR